MVRSSKKKKPSRFANFDQEGSLVDSTINANSLKYLETLKAQQKLNFGEGEARHEAFICHKNARKRLDFRMEHLDRQSRLYGKTISPNQQKLNFAEMEKRQRISKMPRNGSENYTLSRNMKNLNGKGNSQSYTSPPRTYSGQGLFKNSGNVGKTRGNLIWDEDERVSRYDLMAQEDKENNMNTVNMDRRYKNVHHHMSKGLPS